jgi:hypothetical protein
MTKAGVPFSRDPPDLDGVPRNPAWFLGTDGSENVSWPDFLFLGAPRSGTTQLYEGLRQHPAILMSSIKEPLYFVSSRYAVHRVAARAAYQALFSGAGPGRLAGEASTLYLFDPEAARRIRDAVPKARLIAVLRQPVDRAYSQYLFERLLEQEPLNTFEAALAAEPGRMARRASPFLYYREVGRYAQQVERYRELFPSGQLLWLLYDDLRRDQTGTFQRIFRFLDVDDTFVPILEQRVNVSGVPRHRGLYNVVHKGARPFKSWLPDAWVNRLRGPANQALLRAAPGINPATRAELLAYYRDDILKTARLIGRDLSHWLR